MLDALQFNQVVIFATDAEDMIERPTVEPTYSTIEGQKKSFAYKPIRPGVVGSRCASTLGFSAGVWSAGATRRPRR